MTEPPLRRYWISEARSSAWAFGGLQIVGKSVGIPRAQSREHISKTHRTLKARTADSVGKLFHMKHLYFQQKPRCTLRLFALLHDLFKQALGKGTGSSFAMVSRSSAEKPCRRHPRLGSRFE